MNDLMRAILEMTVVIPGLLLAYLPMKAYLKVCPAKLFAGLAPLMIGLCVAGGVCCWLLKIRTTFVLPIVVLIAAWIYVRTLHVSIWKSGNIFLAICAVWVCIYRISGAVDGALQAENNLYFCMRAAIIDNLLCWGFTAIACYPAIRPVKKLIENENMAQTWYFFWILPVVYIVFNLFMVPKQGNVLYVEQTLKDSIFIRIMLLLMLGLLYFLFYLMATSLNKTANLEKEKAFLEMQRVQYDNLCTVIEEIRQAKHDLRHHFTQLSAMADREAWEELKQYLAKAQDRIPSLDMIFSENCAADGVVGHYCALAREQHIPFLAKIALPKEIPFDEMEMCIVLANLLENALEASLRTDSAKRYIRVDVHIHAERILLICLENAFEGDVVEKDGVFQSAKRKEAGIGIRSVRRIAEKNGGGCSFEHEDGVFRAKVMLRRE